MLFLLFQLGTDRYAVEAAKVLEVLPLVNLKQIPNAPSAIAGVLDYHAAPVPIVDLSQLALGKPSRRLMSTRIILVNGEGGPDGPHVLGLMAELVTETLRCTEEEFVEPGVSVLRSLYLGPVVMSATGIIQRVEMGALLSSLRSVLAAERTSPL